MVKEWEETDDTMSSEEQDLAAAFNAKQQLAQFKEILEYYNVDFEDWVACLISDNAAVNGATARLANKPMIGCKNHKLSLEMNAMVDRDVFLNDALARIQQLMLELKTIKNSAALKKFTNLQPQLYNKTRWSGKKVVLSKFIKLRPFLLQLDNESDNFSLSQRLRTGQFLDQAEDYEKQMSEINLVTKEMQTLGYIFKVYRPYR